MKLTKSQLKQIIKEELQGIIEAQEEDETPEEKGEQEPTDLCEMSPSAAFGLAWTQATQHLRDEGMEEAAALLDSLSGNGQVTDPEEEEE